MATLSKSLFIRAHHCVKAMWLDVHCPELRSIAASDRRILDQGVAVGEFARKKYHDGQLVYSRQTSLNDAIRKTRELLGNATLPVTLFEAAFQYENVLVITDILTKSYSGGLTMREVKSSTSVKDNHLLDIALQKWVIENNGYTVDQCIVTYVNNQCIGPDIDNFFTEEDVTEAIQYVEIDHDVAKFKAILDNSSPPCSDLAPLDRHCKRCDYESHCMGELENTSIYYIPRVSETRIRELESRQIIKIEDIPADNSLTVKQQEFVSAFQRKSVSIDIDSIAASMESLEYPLYFFDFETVNPALPFAESLRPFQQTPFQYSCHVLDADGQLRHLEYLHPNPSDPREKLTERMLRDLEAGKSNGSIVVYNQGFEQGVIKRLAEVFPQYNSLLRSLVDRMWDQLPLIRNFYQHYALGASNSIKAVLPIIAPDLSYSELSISQGDQAGDAWLEWVYADSSDSQMQVRDALLAYCKLDTLAMVRLHQHFLDLVNDHRNC